MPSPPTAAAIMRGALFAPGRTWRILLATGGYMIHECAEAMVPLLAGVLIDRAIVPNDGRQLLLWLGILLLNFLVLSYSYRWSARLMVLVYGHAELDIRRSLIARVLHPHGVAGRRSPGDMLTVTTSDSYRVAGISWSLVQQSASVAAIVVSSIALLSISVPLGAGVLVASAAVLLAMHAASKPIEARGSAEQAAAGAASNVATDLVAGLRIVRGIRAQPEAGRRYREASAQAKAGAIAANRGIAKYLSLSALLSGAFLAALAFCAAALAATGAITLGQLVSVVGLGQFLQGSLAHVGTFASSWMHKRASANRIVEVLGGAHAVPLNPAPDNPPAGGGVSAELPETMLPPGAFEWRMPDGRLLCAAPGAVVGIRPTTPSQARQIADLLAYRVPLRPGEVRVDGVDARSVGPHAYRQLVFCPPHDGTLFSASLRENLLAAEADHERAAADAALGDVVAAGWDRPVGEAGRRLSGGQRQRVLLARAFASRSAVMVLDEPATALDPATEARVAQSLRQQRATTLIITRSPLLLAACDRVVGWDREAAADPADGAADASMEKAGL